MKTAAFPTPKLMPKRFEELVALYPPRVIRNEAEYDEMQEVIDILTSIPKLTKGQADYLETLAVLFSDYERVHYPID